MPSKDNKLQLWEQVQGLAESHYIRGGTQGEPGTDIAICNPTLKVPPTHTKYAYGSITCRKCNELVNENPRILFQP